MEKKKFSQEEVNRIVTMRVKRERERLVKEFDIKLKRCMDTIYSMMSQEINEINRKNEDEDIEMH